MTELPSMDEVREQILEVLTETTQRRAHMKELADGVYPQRHWKFWSTKVLREGGQRYYKYNRNLWKMLYRKLANRRGRIIELRYLEAEKLAKKNGTWKAPPRGMGYLKIGRVCLTCKCRCGGKTKNGEFMECAARKEQGLPAVWTMARCAVWELARDPKRLKQYEKHTKLKVCGKPEVFREYFYSRFNTMQWWEYNPLTIGRACFFCVHRGAKYGQVVECNRRKGATVPRWAVCGGFKPLLDEKVWLPQVAKYLRKSGQELGADWWRVDIEKGRSRKNLDEFVNFDHFLTRQAKACYAKTGKYRKGGQLRILSRSELYWRYMMRLGLG